MAQAADDLGPTPATPPRLRLLAWLRPRDLRAPLLDPETLPEPLRRDLGFADGRGAQPRDAWRD